LQSGLRTELLKVDRWKGGKMIQFRWKPNNSLIHCRTYEDTGLVVKLYDGEIKHIDGATSRFDLLILSKNEIEKVEKLPPKKRRLRK